MQHTEIGSEGKAKRLAEEDCGAAVKQISVLCVCVRVSVCVCVCVSVRIWVLIIDRQTISSIKLN